MSPPTLIFANLQNLKGRGVFQPLSSSTVPPSENAWAMTDEPKDNTYELEDEAERQCIFHRLFWVKGSLHSSDT